MNLLFVCSGNTCRSPLAVAAWRAFAPQVWNSATVGLRAPALLLPTIEVESAGLSARDKELVSSYTYEIAEEWGVDLSTHRARRLTADIAGEADLICTMTTDQAATVRLRFAVSPETVRLLGDFSLDGDDYQADQGFSALVNEAVLTNSREPRSILDPYGGSLEAYQTCANEIKSSVMGLARALRGGFMDTLGAKRG